MERFHIITLVVASVSLILVLTIAGILLTKDKRSQKFPTSHSDVPDGWSKAPNTTIPGYTLTSDGTNGDPDTNETKDFNTTGEWKDIDICIKKAWADQNNVYWDGITTYNGC